MINNQRCAQPRRRIIRTDRANRRQGQSAFAVRRGKKPRLFIFSERVLAEERRRRLITDCSPRSEFFQQCLNSKSRKRSEWERRTNIINKRKTPFRLCRRSQRVSNGCLSRRLTLYSRTMPLWLLWGGGSQDTLILELLVSCTTDTACGGALKTGDGDKGRKLYFPLEFVHPHVRTPIAAYFCRWLNVEVISSQCLETFSMKQLCNRTLPIWEFIAPSLKEMLSFKLAAPSGRVPAGWADLLCVTGCTFLSSMCRNKKKKM